VSVEVLGPARSALSEAAGYRGSHFMGLKVFLLESSRKFSNVLECSRDFFGLLKGKLGIESNKEEKET